MSTQNSITIVHHRNRPLPPSPAQAASTGRCHQRQAQAAALRNLPLRSIPSLVPAFMPGLSDRCRSPRRFTQCLRATHSHGHGRPWVSRGHSLPPASPWPFVVCLLPSSSAQPSPNHSFRLCHHSLPTSVVRYFLM